MSIRAKHLVCIVTLSLAAAGASARQQESTLSQGENSIAVRGNEILFGPRLYKWSGATWYQDHGFWNYTVGRNAGIGDAGGFTDSLVVLGAAEESSRGVEAGAAVVFEIDGSTWRERAVLHASDGVAGDRFGEEVAVSGSTVFVGAWRHGDAGAVYVFERQGNVWAEVAKLAPNDLQNGSEFGREIVLEGEWAAIAAPWTSSSGAPPGAVYVYRRVAGEWIFHSKIQRGSTSGFGHAIGLSGDRLAVSMLGRVESEGLVHTYTYEAAEDRWVEESTLGAPGPDPPPGFGWQVGLSRGRLAIGAIGRGDFTRPGSVYLFENFGSGWDFQTRILPADGFFTPRFKMGMSHLVLAVQGWDAAAYVFRLPDVWTGLEDRDVPEPGMDLQLFPTTTSGPLRMRVRSAGCGSTALMLYDALGRFVGRAGESGPQCGPVEVLVDVSGLAPGRYFATLEWDRGSATRPFVVAR